MQGLISNLIRPFRFKYSLFDLGPKITDKYDRNDTTILNDRGYRIQLSYYKNKKPTDICLVYAHCNSGSRIEGLQFVQSTMDQGWNLCLFDFTGSGISEGEYISLGYYEWIDLQTVISFVLKQGNNRINLWGRSMGAATIILYLGETKQIDNIVSCVLDSPYSSLWKVVKQFGKSKTKIPEFIVEHVMQYLRSSIFKDHRFDIKDLDLLKKVHNIELPLMFIASTSDSFVNCSHAAELYKWAGSKQKILEYIEKQHNSPRQTNTIQIGLTFMMKSLNEKQQVRKQLRILSKKKQLCRKMTGHNMAELITKPVKGGASNSVGNLGRFNSLYFNNSSKCSTVNQHKDSVQATIQTIQTSPKQHHDKKSTNKNPHKIQQSIIKLAMPPKQVLQHTKKTSPAPQQQFQQYRLNSTNSHIQMSKIMNNTVIFDKENNVNASNKSKKQKQKQKQGEEGIHSFNSIITKRFHFDAPEFNQAGKKIEPKKSRQRDVKSKTQKINIYLKSAAIQSPPRVTKFGGIKLVNKIKFRKQEKRNEDLLYNKEQQSRRIKQRVKTEVAPIYRESSQSDGKKKVGKDKGRRNQLYSSYSEIGMEENEPGEGKWVCPGNSICRMGPVDSQSKEVYMNKYRDFSRENQRDRQHKISCNQAWISKKQEFSPNGTAQFKHFHSIGELSSSIDEVKKQPTKQVSHGLLGTQKIIKIQLDRNLFQTGVKKMESKPISMEFGEDNKWELEQRHSNPVHSKLTSPIIQLNPSLSKFKLKQKKILRFQQKQGENNSFL